MQNRRIAIIAMSALLATLASSMIPFQSASAHKDDPPFVPSECQTYVGQPSTDHHLTIDSPAPYVPGSTVDLTAGTTDTGTGTNRVRIVAILGGVTIHTSLQVMPNPYGDVSDSFTIPANTPKGTSLDIYACFESPTDIENAVGVTHHLDVGSFFVIPESPMGALALVGASVAALGGYAVYHKRNLA